MTIGGSNLWFQASCCFQQQSFATSLGILIWATPQLSFPSNRVPHISHLNSLSLSPLMRKINPTRVTSLGLKLKGGLLPLGPSPLWDLMIWNVRVALMLTSLCTNSTIFSWTVWRLFVFTAPKKRICLFYEILLNHIFPFYPSQPKQRFFIGPYNSHCCADDEYRICSWVLECERTACFCTKNKICEGTIFWCQKKPL